LIKIARIIPYFKSSFGGPVNHLKKLIFGMRDLEKESLSKKYLQKKS